MQPEIEKILGTLKLLTQPDLNFDLPDYQNGEFVGWVDERNPTFSRVFLSYFWVALRRLTQPTFYPN